MILLYVLAWFLMGVIAVRSAVFIMGDKRLPGAVVAYMALFAPLAFVVMGVIAIACWMSRRCIETKWIEKVYGVEFE